MSSGLFSLSVLVAETTIELYPIFITTETNDIYLTRPRFEPTVPIPMRTRYQLRYEQSVYVHYINAMHGMKQNPEYVNTAMQYSDTNNLSRITLIVDNSTLHKINKYAFIHQS